LCLSLSSFFVEKIFLKKNLILIIICFMNNTEVANAAIRICKIKLPVPGSKYANTGICKT